ncbi:hypothetical protein, partial [Bacillus cereus]|uniref:hypothetical protein n=1 Tax=Bacillus cereus TaxID=1396 RepID=UPI0021123172
LYTVLSLSSFISHIGVLYLQVLYPTHSYFDYLKLVLFLPLTYSEYVAYAFAALKHYKLFGPS